MKTLHLNLKRKWFDMILSGEKPEEYRGIMNYWITRLCLGLWDEYGNENPLILPIKEEDYIRFIFEEFDTITFSNGYSKDRPQFVIEFKGIEIREGNPKWGAKPGKKYFVIKLGKIISKTNV